MTIATLDDLIAGMRPTENFLKNGPTTVAGRLCSLFYSSGYPAAAAAPSSGSAGAALTAYAGQLPFTNPGGGDLSYLARLAAMATQDGTLILCDRLWHNSGLSATLTSAQAVNSAAWPARDKNGSTNGEGVIIGLEVSGVLGAGTPTITLDYTDQDGNTGAVGVSPAIGSASPAGSFYPIPLAAGDTGVRSIQTCQLSATMTSGTYHLVAYRPIVSVPCRAGVEAIVDALSGGMPRLLDDTVPFLLFMPAGTTAPVVMGQLIVSQG